MILFIIAIAWIVFTFVCFFVSSKILNSILIRPNMENWIKNLRWPGLFSKSIKIGMFFLPFLAIMGFDKWKELTFPLVCQSTSGYSSQPVDIMSVFNTNNGRDTFTVRENKSIRSSGDMLRYIVLQGVDFVEWVFHAPIEGFDGGMIEAGNYRAKYYPVGSSQCLVAENIIPHKRTYLEYSKQRFTANGFHIKDTVGMCVGVENVEKLEAVYQIKSEVNVKEMSGYGHSLNVFRTELVNLWTGEVINSVQDVSTYDDMYAPLMFLFLYSPFSGKCYSSNDVRSAHFNMDKKFNIEIGFFKFD